MVNSRPLTPAMQAEVGQLVFANKKKAHMKKYADVEQAQGKGSSIEMNDAAATFDSVYGTAHEGEDTRDHFAAGGMAMADDADWTTRLATQKPVGSSEYMNDRAVSYDVVYGTAHEGEDTRDHFESNAGMVLSDEALPARDRHLLQRSQEAAALQEQVLQEDARPVEKTHMGHEQMGGLAGDTYDHFKGGGMAFDSAKFKQADLAAARKTMGHEQAGGRAGDTFSHFKDGGMAFDTTKFSPEELAKAHALWGEGARPDLMHVGQAREQALAATPAATRQHVVAALTPTTAPATERRSGGSLWNIAARIPDFANKHEPTSPYYLQHLRTPERVAARQAALAALPAAGARSNFRDLKRSPTLHSFGSVAAALSAAHAAVGPSGRDAPPPPHKSWAGQPAALPRRRPTTAVASPGGLSVASPMREPILVPKPSTPYVHKRPMWWGAGQPA